MLPRGLTGRIVVAFAGLAAVMLLSVAATLFLVLRQLHENEIKDSLTRQATAIVATLGNTPIGQWETTLQETGGTVADDGGYILFKGPAGVRILAGNPSSLTIPPAPTDGAKVSTGTTRTSDGQLYVYVERVMGANNARTIVFAVPDRSVSMAIGDLTRALLIVIVVLLAVGVPTAWLLSRSLTGPMRRLASAAAALPAASASGETAPLPLEGPTEVQTLTERFNAMARELASTRAEESQLLANLRHDLRTPLTSISGFAEAIADGTAKGDAATSAARTIAAEAERLERLVGEIGVVERLRQGPGALRPELLDATELLAGAAERFESRAASQGVAIEVAGAIPGEPALALTGDRLAVERIMQNLLDNALSVVPGGGHVWLKAARLTLPGRPPGISIAVTDDGPGFPPGTRDRVFERFYRADPSRSGSGSGLGLAIVRELARAHGGEAWAENVAPHGARVTVLLPIAPVLPGPTGGPSSETAEDART
jgi:two-component system OmpR family sensor kinase